MAVKSMEWCGWEQNRTQLIRRELHTHTLGRNLILSGEWEEDEMLGMAPLGRNQSLPYNWSYS